MNFSEWEPIYCRILDYFGFSREDDETSARILSSLLTRDDLGTVTEKIAGKPVIVAGNAKCLPDDIRKTSFAGSCILAADGAARVLYAKGIVPDIVFTDLDGFDDDILALNVTGTILAVHAHGDNIPLIKSWVPKISGPVIGTTQAQPLSNIHNFGGFSDGDRCVFAAYDLGAASVTLIGFDLDDTGVDPVKHGKLQIARKLLHMLGHDI